MALGLWMWSLKWRRLSSLYRIYTYWATTPSSHDIGLCSRAIYHRNGTCWHWGLGSGVHLHDGWQLLSASCFKKWHFCHFNNTVSKEIILTLLFLLFFLWVWEEVEIWKTWHRVLMCKHQMNSMDFLLIKAHFPAHNSPQLGYTSPGHASKRRENREASQKEVFLATKINLHLPTK